MRRPGLDPGGLGVPSSRLSASCEVQIVRNESEESSLKPSEIVQSLLPWLENDSDIQSLKVCAQGAGNGRWKLGLG
jgi:hypothetical protein